MPHQAKGAPTRPGSMEALFADREPTVLSTYRHLIASLGEIGPVKVEAKKTTAHLVPGAGGAAFAGVHPRKAALLVTIRTDAPLRHARVRTVEQVSKNRYHNDVMLGTPDEVDAELLAWLRAAYDLAKG